MTKINIMYLLSFLFTLLISISAYVNSTFLVGIISEKYVGLLYTIAAIITLILLSRSAGMLKYFGNRRLVIILLLVNMASLVALIVSLDAKLIALSFISFVVTNTLVFLCLDVFIEHFGDPKTIGKTRGLYLTITSLAWMVSPIISTFLITQEGGYPTIYKLALLTVIVMTVGLLFSVRKFDDRTYTRTPFLKTYEYLKTNKHMLAITMINFILQFFFAWMVVYTPIYLHQHIGMSWSQIGIIFTVMLTPFVIFGLPIGVLIDKYHVSKRFLLLIGFMIISIATFSIPYIAVKSVVIWSIVLFLTRMGASIIETTSEIYFFTHVKEEDTYLLGVFRDMIPVAYIVAPLISTLIFIFFPFKHLFTILAIITLAGLYYIPHLKHAHEPTIPNQN